MHGCSSGSALLVNAEVDSMGGVVDSGVGNCIKTSPRRAAIEKAQAELRQEYDVREERRRELEFLEKGGNPLDFKYGNTASASVQSTSLTDHPEFFVASEAKGSFALTASPRGDSIESSGRPGAPTVCEPNTADNLLLFDGENEFIEVERSSRHLNKSNIASSELDGSQNAKESGDSAAFDIPKNRAYKRRNRSRPNRDSARSSSIDIIPSRGGLPARHGMKAKPSSPNGSMVLKAGPSNGQLDVELDGVRAIESASGPNKDGPPEAPSDINALKNLRDNQSNQRSHDDVQESPICMASDEPESVGVGGSEQVITASLECPPCVGTTKVEDQTGSGQLNGFSNVKGDIKRTPNECQNSSVAFSVKGLVSESSCTQTSIGLNGNNDSDLCTNLRNINSNGTTKRILNMENDEMNETIGDDSHAFVNSDHNTDRSNLDSGSIPKVEQDLLESGSGLQNEVNNATSVKGMEPDGFTASEAKREPSNLFGDSSNFQMESACTGRLQGSVDSSAPEQQTSSGTHFILASKAHEDSILEEARIIEAKRKRIAELSVGTLPLENRRRSHWDFVLEEMAWLANDFAQERLWKRTAASQICHRIAFASRLRFEGQNLQWVQKKVAHTLAKAITEFWISAEETSKEPELHCPGKKSGLAVQGYAVRFMKYNSSCVPIGPAEAPVTPDRVSDLGIQKMSWGDHLTEENLFYTVLPGAMEVYRKSIESHLAQCEKTSSNIQEEVETSIYDAVTGSQENGYEEDEGETSTYFLHEASEGIKPSKFSQKKRKNPVKNYAARSYELGSDSAYMQCMENKVGTHQSVLVGKRPANSLNVGPIPTKRVRTASRQRVLSPFGAGTSGCIQAPNKTDASSGDTNSFQDDQSTLHGGCQIPTSLEVESVGDFEKQLPFDSSEVSTKPKKKKKSKHLGSKYEQGWQLDSNFLNEQRDHSRKRSESHQLESNGSSGLFGQHIMKKPKMMKQSLDNSFDNHTPMAGSIPSPVASQMSNMSNPNKFIKMLGSRDRGRKIKALKIPAGQPGSGSPWSLFEDQALVVLVHDMGPNWELISDAINNTLQFKCIFRKPKECKERHNILMDRTAGDGADSAEDSGSSQPYPSTLPGIPKGSARQLFQRLQGPMEEDTLKGHFGKILMIGKKLHYRRTQNDNQDIKQIQPHNSHAIALSQVCPNNLNGGPPLTPLDLCDATASSPDVVGYQGSQSGGLAISNQGTVASVLSASGGNSSLQGSSSMVLGSNFSSPSGPLNASIRDGRYNVPRTASSPLDEQQRMQQYNQMLSGRNIQQSSLPVPSPGTERSVRMLPGGNGMSIMAGANRSMPMARPGFPGIASQSMLNSGSMISSSMVAMPSTVNMHSGAGPGQGNSMLRPRDALHMMRPTQNPDHQRQMMVPEIPMQATQTTSQGLPAFVSSAFTNQTAPPPVQAYPLHHHHLQNQLSPQHSHMLSSHHHPHLQGPNQANAIRIAKERHLQQRLLQQQQQHHFAATNALMPHVQSQPQLPISSSLQNSSQIQSQTSSPPVSMSQHQQKHQMPPHVPPRNSQTGGPTNQMGKQRQRQPHQQQPSQQSSRHHPQQRQQSQSQQQAKLLKGVGRGNMLMHQNLPADPSLLNGLSMAPGSQSAEKGEQAMHLMQGQGLYSGSGLNHPVQPSKPLVPHSSNHSQPQQMYSGQTVPSSKQHQHVPHHSDNGNQGHVPPVTSGPPLSASHQAVPPSGIASSNHHQPQQKLVNQTQPAVQRLLQQNAQTSSDPPSKLQAEQAQADQQPVINSSLMGTSTATPQAYNDPSNVRPVVASASAPQWKVPEQLCDSGIPNSSSELVQNSTNAAGIEPTPPLNQGLGQKQPSHGHNVGTQRQQPPQPSQQQQQQQSPPQLPPQHQSQQQTQHLQAGNTSLYIRPSNSRQE